MLRLVETDKAKAVFSEDFNSIFDKATGETAYWGSTLEENPDCAPFPMILDMEITTSCRGIGTKYGRRKDSTLESNVCPFCYKANGPSGRHMSLETAQAIFEKLPKGLTQIAFGADASLAGNPDWYQIFENCLRRLQSVPWNGLYSQRHGGRHLRRNGRKGCLRVRSLRRVVVRR